MKRIQILAAGIILAGLSVSLGAVGAHAWKNLLLQNNRTETFELAVRYQFYHAIALLVTGLLMKEFVSNLIRIAAWCFLSGAILFSGSLYLLALAGISWAAYLTPIGGILMIIGWFCLLLGLLKKS